jgi:CMP-2-keto-3-deoxyoctulosonic acid synthetase
LDIRKKVTRENCLGSLFDDCLRTKYKCVAVVSQDGVDVAFAVERRELCFCFTRSLCEIGKKRSMEIISRVPLTSRHSIPNAFTNLLN